MPPTPPPRRMGVDMEEVLAAFSRPAGAAVVPHLDLQTGNVVPVPDAHHPAVVPEDLEDDEVRAVLNSPRRYREIPRIAPHEEEDLLREFASAVEDAGTRERLRDVLVSARPMAALARELDRDAALAARWRWWRQEAHLDEAVAWLHMLGLDPVHPLLESHHQEVPAPPPPVPLLLDVLVDGVRTNASGGVAITWSAQDPAHAERAFHAWARQLSVLEAETPGARAGAWRLSTRGAVVEFRRVEPTASG